MEGGHWAAIYKEGLHASIGIPSLPAAWLRKENMHLRQCKEATIFFGTSSMLIFQNMLDSFIENII